MRKKRLYTPQLHEQNVRKLYHIAKRQSIKMTTFLNLIVSVVLEELERAPDLCDEPGIRRGDTEVDHG
jgi:hypothetical protein